eukprot:jgi/Botrbrau1/19157/Bobra.0077s0069.1
MFRAITFVLFWLNAARAYPSRLLIAGGPAGLAPAGYAASAPGPAGADASVLFVMQAANITLTPTPGEPKNFTAVISGVEPTVIAFADAPVRFASSISTTYFTRSPKFVLNGAWLNNPNAAIVGLNTTNATHSAVAVITLFSPKLDSTNTTLTAQARVLEAPKDLANANARPEITFFLSHPEATKRRTGIASATTQQVVYRPTLFIDNLVGFGNDFVGSFLDGGLDGGFV